MKKCGAGFASDLKSCRCAAHSTYSLFTFTYYFFFQKPGPSGPGFFSLSKNCRPHVFAQDFKGLCRGGRLVRPRNAAVFSETYGESECTCTFGCRGRCPHRPGRMHRFYGKLRRIRNFQTGRCGHRPLQSSRKMLFEFAEELSLFAAVCCGRTESSAPTKLSYIDRDRTFLTRCKSPGRLARAFCYVGASGRAGCGSSGAEGPSSEGTVSAGSSSAGGCGSSTGGSSSGTGAGQAGVWG